MRYDHQVILVTGASSGIGRATALELARHSNRLAITARRTELLEETARLAREAGSECLCFPGDATDGAHADHVVSQMVARWGRIDVALLNVGGGRPCNTLGATRETILGSMRANYDSLVNFYVPLMAQMRRQDTACLIAHVNSLASYFGIPMQGDYVPAKAAARLFLDTARMELRHFGVTHIKLQTIHPGFVATQAIAGGNFPTPNLISAEAAARHILAGFASEVPENRFPVTMALAARIGRIAPRWLRTRILLASVPRQYG
jgi:NAD(P)-dependent dehydrogenase (short-subunit alcohol dehydrogenase family)